MKAIADLGYKGFVAQEFIPNAKISWPLSARAYKSATCKGELPGVDCLLARATAFRSGLFFGPSGNDQ
jgi:hypothetical protein